MTFKLPFVLRSTLEKELANSNGIVAYLPSDNQNPSAGTNLAYHDKRIGWVEPRRFRDYDEYLQYLRDEKNAKS